MIDQFGMHWDGPRVTPFSRIDLDGHRYSNFDESLDTMDVTLEQAVLVIRGTHQGKEVEFQVGSLRTEGPDNGMVIIHRAEHTDLHGGDRIIRRLTQSEYRILLDCELLPDKNGHAFTIRTRDGDS